jgi:hypothetical protein
MSRREEEFYCDKSGGGCGKYFKTWLRESMFGNYTMECPNCGHHHFRVIKEGLVTADRHNERMGKAEIILALKSTIRDTPWHDDPEFRRRSLRVYNGGATA